MNMVVPFWLKEPGATTGKGPWSDEFFSHPPTPFVQYVELVWRNWWKSEMALMMPGKDENQVLD